MRAEIILEDRTDGTPGADVKFLFVNGWQPRSDAHQMCNIVRKVLDQMAAAGQLTAVTDRKDIGDMGAANEALAALDIAQPAAGNTLPAIASS